MPRTQRVSDDTESPLRMLVITGPRPPANAAGDRDTFRATDVLENLKQTLAAFLMCRAGKDERNACLHQRLGVRREPLVPVSRRSPAKAWTTPPASPLPHISASVSMPPAFVPTPAKETR